MEDVALILTTLIFFATNENRNMFIWRRKKIPLIFCLSSKTSEFVPAYSSPQSTEYSWKVVLTSNSIQAQKIVTEFKEALSYDSLSIFHFLTQFVWRLTYFCPWKKRILPISVICKKQIRNLIFIKWMFEYCLVNIVGFDYLNIAVFGVFLMTWFKGIFSTIEGSSKFAYSCFFLS